MCSVLSYIGNNYGKSTTEFMKSYDEKILSQLHVAVQINLYGWQLNQCLLTGRLEWLMQDKTYKLHFNAI